MKKLYSLAALLLLMFQAAFAATSQTGNVVTIKGDGGAESLGVLDAYWENCSRANNASGDHLDYFLPNEKAWFIIDNQKEQRYTFQFAASCPNNTVRLVLDVMDEEGTTVFESHTIDIENSGSWNTFKTHSINLDNKLSIGRHRLNMTFLSGNGYTFNSKEFTLTPIDDSILTYKLTTAVNPANSGKIIASPSQSQFEPGTLVKLSAEPAKYFAFVNWTDASGIVGTEATVNHTMDADYSITANFEESPILIPTNDQNPFHTDWAECVNGTWNGNLDSYRNGGTATYKIRNTRTSAYFINFKGATTNADGTTSLTLTLKNSDGETVCEKTADVFQTSGWQNYIDYTVETPVIAAGDYTFVITFNTTQGYTVNVKDIEFKETIPFIETGLTALTIDGLSASDDIIAALNAEGHTATINQSLTVLPVIQGTFGNIIANMGAAPVVDDNTISCATTLVNADGNVVYTIVFNNYHPYEAAEGDLTCIAPLGAGSVNKGVWTNDDITVNGPASWTNPAKLQEGTYTLSFPTNWNIRQLKLRMCKGSGRLASVESEGATVYTPYDATFSANEKAMVFNVENHKTGAPFTFTVEGSNNATIQYIDILYTEQPVSAAPELKSLTQTSTENANHCLITMRFDHAVATAAATVNGETIEPLGLGTTVLSFNVWDLSYNNTYTFEIAKGALADAYGNKNALAITTEIAVGSQAAVEKKAYDYVVKNRDELLAAVAECNKTNTTASAPRKTILMLNGDYDITGPNAAARVTNTAWNVSLIGESREGVFIHGKSDGLDPIVNNRASNNAYLQDFTSRNTDNYHTGNFGPQALALATGKNSIMKNVELEGNQDTYYTDGRAYVENCYIHGSVDFIYGGGDVYFNRCDLILENRAGIVIVAPAHDATTKWGYVFESCTIKKHEECSTGAVQDGNFHLGRPWHNEPRAYYLNTYMWVKPADQGWGSMSSIPTHFYEYNSMDKDGNPIDLSKRGNSPTSTNTYKPVLTAEEAKKFTLHNVTAGTDSWNPTEFTAEAPAVENLAASLTQASWSHESQARCYVVYVNGQYYGNTAENTMAIKGLVEGDKVEVVSVNKVGGFGQRAATTASSTTVIDQSIINRQPANCQSYNLAGLNVNKDCKGVVISNGIKKINK